MLGILLIYFIGKFFYDLAGDHDHNSWLFAIIGVVTYYAGTFVGGILIFSIAELISPGWVTDVNEFLLSFMALPFGLLACWGLYGILTSVWSKKQRNTLEAIEQIGQE